MDYYIGLSLAPNSTTDSGVAVLDANNKIIFVDKLYKVSDIVYFFENFSSLKNSKICVSVPNDRTLLEGKWRILSKPYQMVATNPLFPNRDNWTQRHSNRCSEYLNELVKQGIVVKRFDVYMARQSFCLNSCFKDRSPADCKFLQQALKYEYGFIDLPVNMMPMSHLEAIVGAMLIRKYTLNPETVTDLYKFNNIEVINLKEHSLVV